MELIRFEMQHKDKFLLKMLNNKKNFFFFASGL